MEFCLVFVALMILFCLLLMEWQIRLIKGVMKSFGQACIKHLQLEISLIKSVIELLGKNNSKKRG